MTARWTWHGGGLAAARAHFGDHAEGWLDLSTGINPDPWPGADGVAIDWHRLPDEQGLAELEAVAAAYFGTDPAHVCALPGTEVGLRLVGNLLPGPARHLAPSYRTHAEMAIDSRPLKKMEEDGGETLILANPGNPAAHVFPQQALLTLLERRGPGGWLVIDEAFADVAPEASMAGHVAEDRRLLVFRSFGKFFGLAGVRLGFLLGPREMVARMRARLGAWPVSAAAIAIGTVAYRDHAWIDATRRTLVQRAHALDGVLRRASYRPLGQCDLFRLIEAEDALALFERLARRAILTRPFDYAPHWLRIGLPRGDAELARLEQVLRHV